MNLSEWTSEKLQVTSIAFKADDSIPAKYTCEGADINPPLGIGGIPPNTRSLVLIVDDPDAPRGTWLHWLVWNIPVGPLIKEGDVPGIEGMNDFGRTNYGGPCPPSGSHRYFFRLFALDNLLDLARGSSRSQLEQAMKGHIVAYGELMGRYKKKRP